MSGPGDHDCFPRQGQVGRRAQVQARHFTYDDGQRRAQGDGRQAGQGRTHGRLARAGAPLHGQHRCQGAHPSGHQALGDPLAVSGAHKDHDRPPGAGQRLPVRAPGARGGVDRAAVAGDNGEGSNQAPVGDGDAGAGRGGYGGADAGDHLERHAGRLQGQRLLPAAPEDERVAAL